MLRDAVRNAKNAFFSTLNGQYKDRARSLRGDVYLKLRNAKTGALEYEWEKHNLIVRDASILIARLVKDKNEIPEGAFVLAVGSGDAGWDLQAPPAATDTQRALYSEIARKRFAETSFVDGSGATVGYPTNVVDFRTVFSEAEAVGPLVEMGLLGGNISSNLSIRNPVTPPNGPYDPMVDLSESETMLNYLTFQVVNKPATSTLELVWRLTF